MSGNTGPAVGIFRDRHALSLGAADAFRSFARTAIPAGGRFAAALSGGRTPRELYALLAENPHADQLAWDRIHLFWADERCVPPDHEDSNFKLVHDHLLSRVPIPRKNIHRIRGEAGAERAAAAYEQELNVFFSAQGRPGMDLVILGVGEDGHTASLFPGSSHLRERSRLAVPVLLGGQKKDRVTLTLPLLNQAKQVLFLAAGQAKAEVVKSILVDGNPSGLPAGLVRPAAGSVRWFLDQEAASLLPPQQVIPAPAN